MTFLRTACGDEVDIPTSSLTLLVPPLEKQNGARGDYARDDVFGNFAPQLRHFEWSEAKSRNLNNIKKGGYPSTSSG